MIIMPVAPIRKFCAPPRLTIIDPNMPPAAICQAPVIPVPVPALEPAAEIAPIVELAITMPLLKPNKQQGSASDNGCVIPMSCVINSAMTDSRLKEQPIIAARSIPRDTK